MRNVLGFFFCLFVLVFVFFFRKKHTLTLITIDVNSNKRAMHWCDAFPPASISVKSYPSCQCRSCSLDLEMLFQMLPA